MSEINLLQPDTSGATSIADKSKRLLARLLMLGLILVVAFYGYLLYDSYSTKKSMALTQTRIAEAQAAAVNNPDRDEVITRQGQIKELDSLIGGHLYWSYLLPELARVTLTSAKYSSMEADSSGKLNLTVQLPTYNDIEKFLQIFDLPEYNQQFSNVKVLAINKIQQDANVATSVTLQLTFNPGFIKGHLENK